jgi:hypothetical protein
VRVLEVLFDGLCSQAMNSTERYMKGDAEGEFMPLALWGRR